MHADAHVTIEPFLAVLCRVRSLGNSTSVSLYRSSLQSGKGTNKNGAAQTQTVRAEDERF